MQKNCRFRDDRAQYPIPVIPGFNDTPEEIRDIAVFTRELGHVKRLHLLPYHRLGQDKYDGLNRPYLMGEVAAGQ